MKNVLLLIILALLFSSCRQPGRHRKQLSLNGEWEITKTSSFEDRPSSFESKIPVPGLVDLAKPALDVNSDYDSGVYWYKKTFTIDEDYPELVKLKIGKVKYHARVFLNDQYVGEQVYAFTSAEFNIKSFLNPSGESNELRIAVGVVKDMPDSVIWGRDNEKRTYIPGIYDQVCLVLSGTPFVKSVQTAPMIETGQVRIVAEMESEGSKKEPIHLRYTIKELASGLTVAEGSSSEADFTVDLPDFQLWSPESPFLYSLHLSTGADDRTVRFGMRSFYFDPESNQAILNGKPYYMRGTNVTIGRFFEDPERELLPWDENWVTHLHAKFKDMHWNSIRYCIGLPPERWYDIADSLGFLIQNEYPIWTGFKGFHNIYPGVTGETLANEFRDWLPEHWNHPSVVIWDAQNESMTEVTGEAITWVRDIDLSDRPWENGWSTPQRDSDPMETHPYLFMRYRRTEPSDKGALSDLLNTIHIPDEGANRHDRVKGQLRYDNPILINEYAWLWLNRDGSTTTLTDRVYDVAFGTELTTEQRYYIFARHLGMLTEYWRAHRMTAGILHFCGLGYSRAKPPRGQTSDHFIDIKNLEYEPEFVKYVKPSFAPVGLMVDFWEKTISPGAPMGLEVYTVNDLDSSWSGELNLTIRNENKTIYSKSKRIDIPEYERVVTTFPVEMPFEKGSYVVQAEITLNGEPVKSIREFEVE